MKKVLKIIVTTIILGIICYNASFAAGLGEKEGGAIVVSIYNNNTFNALNVTTEALKDGQVLDWNKWSNEDLIIVHDRCRKGAVKFNKKDKWYINYKEEFQKRIDNKQIKATGTNNSNYSESTEYKSLTDSSEDVKKTDPNEYKNYTPIEIVKHLEEEKKVPDNCRVIWEQRLKEEVEQMEKNKGSIQYSKFKSVYEQYFGPYITISGETGSQQSGTQSQQTNKKPGDSGTVSSINPDDYKPGSLDSSSNAEELGKIGNVIIGFIQAIGSIVSVAVLGVLGIKYMIGSAEEKAEYKKSLKPYIIGAVMVFAITNLLGILAPIAKNLFGNI